jgi:hypothetical protein
MKGTTNKGKRNGKKIYKHIPVFEPTYEELCNVGRKQDTFDEIVNRLLDNYNGKARGSR